MSIDAPELGTVDWWLTVRKGEDDMVPRGPYTATTIKPDRTITQPILIDNEISAIRLVVDVTATRQRGAQYEWDCVVADSSGRCCALGAALNPISMWWMIDEWRDLLPIIYPDDPILVASLQVALAGELDDIHDFHGRN